MNNINALVLCVVLIHLGQKAHGSEIINGKKASSNSLQYMASVQNDSIHVCGGFLVSKDFVVTAAHCDPGDDAKMSVVVGTHNLKKINEREMRYNVIKCRHPDYEPANDWSGSDIMLLKLIRTSGQRKPRKTIKLPNKKDKPIKAKTKCFVAGWGRTHTTQTDGPNSDDLQEVDVSTIDLKVCQTAWQGNLPHSIICAGGYGTDKGFCQGDSGGPLVCNRKAFGIVSFNNGKNCDYPTPQPNIYTDVSKYLPWIKEIMKKKTC